MGYRTHESEVYVHANRWTDVRLKPQWYELGEVTVRPLRQLEEMGSVHPPIPCRSAAATCSHKYGCCLG